MHNIIRSLGSYGTCASLGFVLCSRLTPPTHGENRVGRFSCCPVAAGAVFGTKLVMDFVPPYNSEIRTNTLLVLVRDLLWGIGDRCQLCIHTALLSGLSLSSVRPRLAASELVIQTHNDCHLSHPPFPHRGVRNKKEVRNLASGHGDTLPPATRRVR